jgi:hypothetical protein
MKKSLFALLLAFVSLSAFSQQSNLLTDNSLEGIDSIRNRSFTNEALWGYINGGADLYMEYNFRQLDVQQISIEGVEYTAEIYHMASPEEAYGIFSILRFRCDEINVLHYQDCLTPFRYMASKGWYFISVNSSEQSLKARETTLKIGNELLKNTEEIRHERPPILNLEIFKHARNDVKMMQGPLGLQNGWPAWEELFTASGSFRLWLMPLELFETPVKLAWVTFDSRESGEMFLKNNRILTPDPAYLNPTDEVVRYAFFAENAFVIFEGPMPQQVYYMILDMYYSRF